MYFMYLIYFLFFNHAFLFIWIHPNVNLDICRLKVPYSKNGFSLFAQFPETFAPYCTKYILVNVLKFSKYRVSTEGQCS